MSPIAYRPLPLVLFLITLTGCARVSGPSSEDNPGEEEAETFAYATGRDTIDAYFKGTFGLDLDNIYWGEFHAHSSYSLDTLGIGGVPNDPAGAYAYARDTEGLDFVGLSDHAEEPNLSATPRGTTIWESSLSIAQQFNDEQGAGGRPFIVFAGWEYTNTYGCYLLGKNCGSEVGFGHKNVLFRALDPAALPAGRYGVGLMTPQAYVAPTANELWAGLSPYRPACEGCEGNALTGPHTPSMSGEATLDDHRTDWDTMDKDFVRNVEIYSKWGSSEGPAPSYCSAPDAPFEYDSARSDDQRSIRQILANRWRTSGDERFLLGIVGGTDTHDGKPGNAKIQGGTMKYRGAITGIAAPQLSRDDLWTGIWRRHTLASTTSSSHTRIPLLVAVEVAGQHLLMGERGTVRQRSVRLRVLASEGVESLEILVDGCLTSVTAGSVLDLELPLNLSRHFIYVRAKQTIAGELHLTWSSPIYLG